MPLSPAPGVVLVTVGGVASEDEDAAPDTSISVMLTQSLCVLPVTVIRTYLACVSVMSYLSTAVVVPLLLPEKTLVKLLPSFETAIVKVFCLSFPLNQLIFTLQTVF